MSFQSSICQIVAGDKLFGTGFLFEDGAQYVLTAYHVVRAIVRTAGGTVARGTVPDGLNVSARFTYADRVAVVDSVHLFDQNADWAVLKLRKTLDIPPLGSAHPLPDADARTWGFPNVLDNGIDVPGAADLRGRVVNVHPTNTTFAIQVPEANGPCNGMSGAPVLVDGKWVGIVLSANELANGQPAFSQLLARRAQEIVDACVREPLPVRGSRYGVPRLTGPWPKDPFPGLVPLSDRYAGLLYGRFRVLWRLLDMVRNPSPRTIIVTGGVGVGKSSLLQAGLIPHLRNDGARPLFVAHSGGDIAASLDELPKETTNGAVLVIDQAEESLTQGSTRCVRFAQTLAQLLGDPSREPRRVFIGCRADYAHSLESHLRDAGIVDRRSYTLKPLKQSDIVEVLTLAGERPALDEYKLEIRYSNEECKRFAQHLLEAKEGWQAPLLQLRMRHMYEHAATNADGYRVFDADLYRRAERDVDSLSRHLATQMAALPRAVQEHVDSGLVLDILEFHTEKPGKTRSITRAQLDARYCSTPRAGRARPPCTRDSLDAMIASLQSGKLLVDVGDAARGDDPLEQRPPIAQDERTLFVAASGSAEELVAFAKARAIDWPAEARDALEQGVLGRVIDALRSPDGADSPRTRRELTMIATPALVDELEAGGFIVDQRRASWTTSPGHDALAAVIRDAYFSSARRGQRGRKLLEFRLAQDRKVVLDDKDLVVIEEGVPGMRTLSGDEVNCLERSVAARRKRTWRRRVINAVIAASATTVLSLVGFIVWQRGESERRQKEEAERVYAADLRAQSGALALERRNFVDAEVALVESLLSHDKPERRDDLLRARGGGMRLDLRDAGSSRGRLSTISGDGQRVATVRGEMIDIGPASNDLLSSPTWRLPVPAGGVEGLELTSGTTATAKIAVARSADFHVAVYVLPAHTSTPEELVVLDSCSKRVASMDFHPDGRRLVIACDDGAVGLYDVERKDSPELWSNPQAHSIAAHGVAFNPDGTKFASAGGDYGIKLWKTDAPGPEPWRALWGHEDSVFAVAFSPDGKLLASGGYDRAIHVRDLTQFEDGQPCGSPEPEIGCGISRVMQGHEGVILSLRFANDRSLLMSGSKDGLAILWDVERARALMALAPDVGPVRAVSATTFGEAIAVGGENGWARWESAGRREMRRLWGAGKAFTAVGFAPESQGTLVTGTADGRIQSWPIAGGAPIEIYKATGTINNVVVSSDGRWLAAGTDGHKLFVWRRDGEVWTLARTVDAVGSVWGLAFSRDSRWLAMGCSKKSQTEPARIELYDLMDGAKTRSEIPVPHDVYALAIVRDRVVSGDSAGYVRSYPLPTSSGEGLTATPASSRQLVLHGEQNVWSVVPMHDHGWVVAGNSDGIVRVWDPVNDVVIAATNEPSVNPTINSVAYNEKAHRIAASGDGKQVVEYDASTLRPGSHDVTLAAAERIFGQDGTVWMAAYSESGRWLAYGGLDGFCRLVDRDAVHAVRTAPPPTLAQDTKAATGRDAQARSNTRTSAP
jgi:WD40 repeat protein